MVPSCEIHVEAMDQWTDTGMSAIPCVCIDGFMINLGDRTDVPCSFLRSNQHTSNRNTLGLAGS